MPLIVTYLLSILVQRVLCPVTTRHSTLVTLVLTSYENGDIKRKFGISVRMTVTSVVGTNVVIVCRPILWSQQQVLPGLLSHNRGMPTRVPCMS